MTQAGTDVELDRPEVVAEVLSAFHRYERALVEGDVAVLTELFWDDPRCLRYGVADRQRGAEAIVAWRHEHPAVPAGRRLRETQVLAVDDRTAVISTLFDHPGGCVEGRQSQVWVRFGDGWRIVAAHVSEVPRGQHHLPGVAQPDAGYPRCMTEFEAERGMPADADAVFAVVADLERLPEWMPPPVGVRATGDGAVHAEVKPRDVDADGLVRVRPSQLRVEWGSEGTPDYAGWLQVMHADPGRSSVTLHLSFLGHQPETHGGAAADELRHWLDDALDRLERLVAAG